MNLKCLLLILVLTIFIILKLFLNNSNSTKECFTKTKTELLAQYNNIFPNRNRNAASHRWVHAIVKDSDKMTYKQFVTQFQAFCPVSGSPIRGSSPTFEIELPTTTGESVTGIIKHCCWPCACDLKDAAQNSSLEIHIENIKFVDKAVEVPVPFIVMDDPCLDTSITIPGGAPDVTCNSMGRLENSIKFNGKVAIGLLHKREDLENDTVSEFPTESCTNRVNNGYRSGMGTMFRIVAGL